jgi:hypothetical protein
MCVQLLRLIQGKCVWVDSYTVDGSRGRGDILRDQCFASQICRVSAWKSVGRGGQDSVTIPNFVRELTHTKFLAISQTSGGVSINGDILPELVQELFVGSDNFRYPTHSGLEATHAICGPGQDLTELYYEMHSPYAAPDVQDEVCKKWPVLCMSYAACKRAGDKEAHQVATLALAANVDRAQALADGAAAGATREARERERLLRHMRMRNVHLRTGVKNGEGRHGTSHLGASMGKGLGKGTSAKQASRNAKNNTKNNGKRAVGEPMPCPTPQCACEIKNDTNRTKAMRTHLRQPAAKKCRIFIESADLSSLSGAAKTNMYRWQQQTAKAAKELAGVTEYGSRKKYEAAVKAAKAKG